MRPMSRPPNAMQRYRSTFIQRDLVAELEGLAARALPPLETLEVDGWRLRSARGFTKRANSVWPRAGTGRVPLDRKLEHVERFYRVRGLPACYQLSPSSDPPGLDGLLAERGYRSVAPTQVRHGRLDGLSTPVVAGADIEPTTQPTAAWLATWGRLRSSTEREVDAAAAVYRRVPALSAYVLLRLHDGDVAVARGVAEGGWLGVLDLLTDPAHRRRGAARAVVGRLAAWGAGTGAERAWLQVEAANEPMLAFCARLGLRTAYDYRYRMQPQGGVTT
jgi:N-acetylglutamate synthase